MSNFMKIRQVEADFFHVDRRSHMRKLRVAFRNFANAPKKHSEQRLSCLLLVALLYYVGAVMECLSVAHIRHMSHLVQL